MRTGGAGRSRVLLAVLGLTAGLAFSQPAEEPAPQPCPNGLVKRLEREAGRGSAAAQKQLGDLYGAGRCVPQDYARAATWYRRSARQGNPDAQFELAMYLLEGKEVRLDPAEAAVWFRRAAEQNHHRAQYALGSLYVQGRGLSKDMVKGYKWIRISAPETDIHTRDILAMISKSMTQSEVERAEAQARAWMDSHRASQPSRPATH